MAITVQSAAPPHAILAFGHPGKMVKERISLVHVDAALPRRLIVDAGQDLFHSIHSDLDRIAAKACAFVLRDGNIIDPVIMTGGVGRNGRPMGFLGPHPMPGSYDVLAGAGSTGIGGDSKRITHCHAAFRAADGRLIGGHLLPGRTIAGDSGIAVDIIVVRRGHFVCRPDAETLFDIFHPEPE